MYLNLSKPHSLLQKIDLPRNSKAVAGGEFLHISLELNTHFEWVGHRGDKAKGSGLSRSRASTEQSGSHSSVKHAQDS